MAKVKGSTNFRFSGPMGATSRKVGGIENSGNKGIQAEMKRLRKQQAEDRQKDSQGTDQDGCE